MNRLSASLGFCRYALKHPKVLRAARASAFFLALDLLVLVFFWGPLAFEHHRLVKGIGDYREAVLRDRRAREEGLRYGRLVGRVKVLEAKWSTPVTQAQLIESLTRLSRKNGLKVVSQDFDVDPAKGGGRTFKQNIALVGSYSSLRRFLADLENLATLTTVEKARLERAGDSGAEVRAVLELSTFTQSSGKGA